MTHRIPLLALLAGSAAIAAASTSPVDFVNPRIGNVSHLLQPTYPTVSLPNGMLRVIPNRGDAIADAVNGFSFSYINHRGSSALDVSPFVGDQVRAVGRYSIDSEHLTPYHYQARIIETGGTVEFAPSRQAGIYKFTFGKVGQRTLVFHSGDGELKFDGKAVSGFRNLGNGTRMYLYAVPSLPGQPENVEGATAIRFDGLPESVSVRYGISFISVDQAAKNLAAQAPNFDLNTLAKRGKAEWNNALGKIEVTGGSDDQKKAFYTALYRTYERMTNISEDGHYWSAYDHQVHDDKGTPFYVDDWIWDTFRAAHPLHTILNPEIEGAKVASYIRMAEQNPEQWMPTFPQINGDNHCMNGNHFVSVLWDSYQKGVRGFDLAKGYELCKRTLEQSTKSPWMRGPANELDQFYAQKGYWPALHPGETEMVKGVHGWERRQAIPVTLAASYDAWCMAQIAKELGKEEDAKAFTKESFNYRNVFNPESGFFHPKDAKGEFIQPFDYKFSGGIGARDYYDENNGWTYRWDVQHNIPDLVKLMGGPEKFVANLDQTFHEGLGKSKYDFYAVLPDQTGNVGQFSMGNEPSLHIPYLYNYAGAAWKTQRRIRQLLDIWFRNDLMGIPGDEDGGGMSSFVVFSSMGFYPETPGTGEYTIGSPLFSKISIKVGKGKVFTVEAKNCSNDNLYIQSATLNGVKLDKPWFSHRAVVDGGKLVLEMGPKPNMTWGKG